MSDPKQLLRGKIRPWMVGVIIVLLAGVGAVVAILVSGNGDGNGDGGGIGQVDGGTTSGIRLESAGGELLQVSDSGRLQFRLSEGQESADEIQRPPFAAGTPLSEDEINAILDRLPELIAEEEDVREFNLPEESLPPPRPGETIEETFPPPPEDVSPPEVAEGPLEVLRYSPEGEIPLAPFLNVTFNQPMVALDTIGSLSQQDVPVNLTPVIPGEWKWVGTKTLRFEYKSEDVDRFPMSTEFHVEIPAGTESAVGGVLAQSVEWSFSTPPVQLQEYYPSYGSQPLEPVLVLGFDQLIDPQEVLATIDLTAGGESFSLRLATEAEVQADDQAANLVKRLQPDRWLALRAESPLPADSLVTVTVGPGTPSAEGPIATSEAQSFTFNTYPPLRITDHSCGWYEGECPPYTPFYVNFSNPINRDSFETSMITIEPEIRGTSISLSGNNLTIKGATVGQTRYRVTIAGEIEDIFGQKLGSDQRLTFNVGSAEPALVGPDKTFVTVDPSLEEPSFSVYTINMTRLNLKVYAVTPADWPQYSSYLREFYRQQTAPIPPGREVLAREVRVESVTDEMTETVIDLTEALEGVYGHLIVVVQPEDRSLDSDQRRYRTVQAWVQVTEIGLDAFVDAEEMVIWATELQDGRPIQGVEISAGNQSAVTNNDGLARVEFTTSAIPFITGTRGDDTALLPRSTYMWDDNGWQRHSIEDQLRWYVIDDRAMYRPGEEVHVKGWARLYGSKENGDLGLLTGIADRVSYQVIGPQGNELFSGSTELTPLGGFDFSFEIPENANLGHASIQLSANTSANVSGREAWHGFQIQEFRRPEFEVTSRVESEGPFYVGESATVAVSAQYYAGGALPDAEVNWNVWSSSASYAPPNWPDFVFGKWTPWWWFAREPMYDSPIYYESFPQSPTGDVQTFSGVTDAGGEHFLQIDFESATEPEPYTLMAEATVIDVNRQAWSSSSNVLVHPSELYVGLRSERYFVRQGTPMEIESIVTDVDGNALPGKQIEIEAAILEWQYGDEGWQEVKVDSQICRIQSGSEPVSCEFNTDKGGKYTITATVKDASGRANLTQIQRWVSGGQQRPSRDVEQEEVTLVPDKETYQPGDVAEILVQSPFTRAEGLLTVSRSGILYTEYFALEDGNAVLQVPIEDAHIPNLHIQVDLAGAAQRLDDQGEVVESAPPRPAYATGSLSLNIPPLSRTLSLELNPAENALEPGSETVLELTVTNAAGQPVNGAEVAVIVVDEAILALTNYQLTDPIVTFYLQRPPGFDSFYGRGSIVLARPDLLVEGVGGAASAVEATRVMTEMAVEEEGLAMLSMEAPAAEPAMDEDLQSAPGQVIALRTDFNPLATFAPAVLTDSSGKAQVAIELPDNLTRYRIMAVAVADGKEFGSAESNLVARLPLMVRPSAPRFLNFGDEFELPVLIQNQTDEDLDVDVAIKATNLELTEGAGRRVTVLANDRVEVRFPATTISAGTTRLQFAAVSGSYADAAQIELPVYTPATTEAFAVYGVLDEGAVAQPVAAPTGLFPQYGGLEINTSSTALQALTDAVIYLVDYPYDCSEQIASRILSIAALREVLDAFDAEGLPPATELERAIQLDIEELQGLQNPDGGFPVWQRYRKSIPFYTIHAAHALQRAQMEGFQVDPEVRRQAGLYLRDIESHYENWYSQETKDALSAYALYVRYLMGDVDRAKALRIVDQRGLENLSLEAIAWLWQVLGSDSAVSSEIARHFNNRAVETADAANFTTSYGDQEYVLLHSDRRTDGLILDAMIRNQPDNDLIPKIVNGLLAHQTRGRWYNTQENVFILLALDNYFRTFEAQTPEFVANIWLGDTYVGGHEFVGRTTERHLTDIPMSYLVESGVPGETQDLILSKEGPGRLYYRLGLSYAPTDLQLDPLDRGFVVERTYEAVDDPEDVTRDEDGVWHIRAGARVRVKLLMVADNRRYHVALVDPLPAGLEIVNPSLAVSGEAPTDPDRSDYRGWWWWWSWYEHQNMRDERAEAFATLLWEGVYDYTYIARATTPGTFIVPPAKAEEMYSPDVFGRSSSDLVIVQ